ncbi:hypothetical protein AOR13_1233 [Alteromonas stellipolaris LMG 21856]|nr:hypothetical protein AOR13_1233 [Alteromonas stellipolaris LMG 21856]
MRVNSVKTLFSEPPSADRNNQNIIKVRIHAGGFAIMHYSQCPLVLS